MLKTFFSAGDDDDIDIEYDADGNPIAPVKSKYIDPLPPIDHSKIVYKPFEKNFYVEHTDITGQNPKVYSDTHKGWDCKDNLIWRSKGKIKSFVLNIIV